MIDMKTLFARIQIYLVIFFLLLVPSFWLSRGGEFETTSIIEGRILNVFPNFGINEIGRSLWLVVRGRFQDAGGVFIGPLASQTIQTQFSNAASDQFPLRLPLIRFAKAADRVMIDTTYTFMPDQMVPADTKTQIYISKDGTTVIKGLLFFNDETRDKLDERIANYSALADEFPEKHFFIFYFEKPAYSSLDPRLGTFQNLDGGRSFEYFKANLPSNITLGEMDLSSIDEYNTNFYHTDHHWNIRGAWAAYQDMYTMVSTHYPEISPVNNSIQYITYPDLTFLGTYARDTLYPFKPEPFEIARVELPEYSIIERDFKISYNQSEQYNNGIFEHDPYVSHYAKYFGTNNALLTYHFENGATRNLLLIGTSYKIPIQPWIASHYNESYFIIPFENPDFSLKRFLRQNQVDDIIILTDMDELLDPVNAINP